MKSFFLQLARCAVIVWVTPTWPLAALLCVLVCGGDYMLSRVVDTLDTMAARLRALETR